MVFYMHKVLGKILSQFPR